MLKNTTGPAQKKEVFIYLFFLFWLVIWITSRDRVFVEYKDYYKFALGVSLENLRAYHSSFGHQVDDFYRILKFCDRRLPQNEEIQIILSTENYFKYLYLREKARYFLYPRNYGENAIPKNFVLVYQNDDFVIPDDYEIMATFGVHKYLLRKTKLAKGTRHDAQ